MRFRCPDPREFLAGSIEPDELPLSTGRTGAIDNRSRRRRGDCRQTRARFGRDAFGEHHRLTDERDRCWIETMREERRVLQIQHVIRWCEDGWRVRVEQTVN